MASFAYKIRSDKCVVGRAKFPYHPAPLSDELLSSWLTRTALRHLTDPATFVNLYLPRWKNVIWTRDLDMWADRELLEALSIKSRCAYDDLYDLTLRSYEGYLAETITPKTRNPFIQNLVNCCRIKIGNGLRFCPECLRTDAIPYFRKKWRLSFTTA